MNAAPATWIELDVTSLVTGDGTHPFVLQADTNVNGQEFRTTEHANAPVRITHE